MKNLRDRYKKKHRKLKAGKKVILLICALIFYWAHFAEADYAELSSLSFNPSRGYATTPILITVNSFGSNLKYKFLVNDIDYCDDPENPNWKLLQDWSFANTCQWIPLLSGLHTIVVWISSDISDCPVQIGGTYYVHPYSGQRIPNSHWLLGTWRFTYTISDPLFGDIAFTRYYYLTDISDLNEQGDYWISGGDEFGGIVWGTYWPQDGCFTLYDYGSQHDLYFEFRLNSSGDQIISGCFFKADKNTNQIVSICYPLSGYKISQ